MKKILLFALVVYSITLSATVQAEAPIEVKPPKVLTVSETLQLYADMYDVSYPEMLATAKCESSLNPLATNSTDKEYSIGIAQINLKAHTHITVEQARDINFASEFMAKKFSQGQQRIWTCWVKQFK